MTSKWHGFVVRRSKKKHEHTAIVSKFGSLFTIYISLRKTLLVEDGEVGWREGVLNANISQAMHPLK